MTRSVSLPQVVELVRVADGIGPVAWGSDGSRPRAISQEPSWVTAKADPTGDWPAVRMDGPAAFRWAVTAIAPVARQACALAGVALEDIAVLAPHQANLRGCCAGRRSSLSGTSTGRWTSTPGRCLP